MKPPPFEVADIIRAYGDNFIEKNRSWLTWFHLRVLFAIEHCRTAALGGHLDRCRQCGYEATSFNSCRSRHCPKCQTNARNHWLAERSKELLPTKYVHVVFTIPHELSWLALQNKKVVYDLLFRCSAATLLEIAADPKHRQQLRCAGPAAALADPKQFRRFLRQLHRQDWVVYAKPAFGGPKKVLRYLGRYTHRIAISNHRLLTFDGERVTFRWKDYAHGGKQRTMTLLGTEFLRRFFLHVLPKGFVRIRYFGFLANRFRAHCLPLCQRLLASARPPPATSLETASNWHCPNCGATMMVIRRLTAVELSRCAYFDTS